MIRCTMTVEVIRYIMTVEVIKHIVTVADSDNIDSYENHGCRELEIPSSWSM